MPSRPTVVSFLKSGLDECARCARDRRATHESHHHGWARFLRKSQLSRLFSAFTTASREVVKAPKAAMKSRAARRIAALDLAAGEAVADAADAVGELEQHAREGQEYHDLSTILLYHQHTQEHQPARRREAKMENLGDFGGIGRVVWVDKHCKN